MTFDAALRNGFTEEDGRFDVFWNDQLVGTIEPEANRFEDFTFHVTGTGGQDRLSFQESLGNINARSTGGILDNVSLVPVEASDQQIIGSAGVDTIVGRDSADQINGGAGNDYLYGAGGNDVLTAGSGRNLIDGGEGIDIAVIDGDRADYRVGLDGDGGVFLYSTEFGMRVAQQHLVDIETVRFNDGTVSIAELTQDNNRFIIADDSEDLVIGSEGRDVIFGGVQGHNILMGLGGNDLLIASGGKDDILLGGDGNDRLEGGVSEGVFFDGGAGDDTILGSTGNDLVLFSGEGGDDTFVGNGGNDIIIVTDEFGSSVRAIGNLQFNLTQGTATQTTVGANNYTVFNFSADAVGTLTYTDDSGDVSTLNFRDVDQLNLGIDVGFGSGENTFSPVSGVGDILVSGPQRFDDYIQYGGDGDDSLFGATPGRDLLIGGAGDDFASGFVGEDYIFGGAGNDELHGRSENDYLDGGTGNDLLNGWQDDDTLIGGEGNDTIDGGDGIDVAVYSSNRDQYTVAQNGDGSVTITSIGTATDGVDTVTNTVENFQFADQTVDRAGLLNTIPGPTAIEVNLINNIPTENQFVGGTAGIDAFVINGTSTDYGWGATGDGLGTVVWQGATFDVLTGVEIVAFNDGLVTRLADGTYDFTAGGTVTQAQTTAPTTDQNITGTDGNDNLIGGAGNDTISAGAGFDILTGLVGNDTLTGGALGDTFVFTENNGNDTVTDFEAGSDLLDFSDVADALGDLTIQTTGGDTVISFADGSVTLQGFDGNFQAGDVVIDGDVVI